MSEAEKDKIILELQRRVDRIEGRDEEGIATFSFSNIKLTDLEELLEIEENFNQDIFKDWFNSDIVLENETDIFIEKLLEREKFNIKFYNEEDLKMKFLSPLFTDIQFANREYKIRDFYEYRLTYKTDKFIFTGITDFFISKGVQTPKNPYFFIQEFKKGKLSSDPEPQLLAELISAVELNDETVIKGAYIVGAIWNFVILEKLGEKKYQYFVSENFDSTKIADLKNIYKNLVFVREEILERVKRERG